MDIILCVMLGVFLIAAFVGIGIVIGIHSVMSKYLKVSTKLLKCAMKSFDSMEKIMEKQIEDM